MVRISSFGPPMAYAALTLLLPLPGMSTIESRGIDISRFGPAPMCSTMIVSVRWPLAPPVPSRLRSSVDRSSRRVAADDEVRRAGLVVGTVAVGERVDGGDLLEREDRHRDQEHDPEQQQRAATQRNGRLGRRSQERGPRGPPPPVLPVWRGGAAGGGGCR